MVISPGEMVKKRDVTLDHQHRKELDDNTLIKHINHVWIHLNHHHPMAGYFFFFAERRTGGGFCSIVDN